METQTDRDIDKEGQKQIHIQRLTDTDRGTDEGRHRQAGTERGRVIERHRP